MSKNFERSTQRSHKFHSDTFNSSTFNPSKIALGPFDEKAALKQYGEYLEIDVESESHMRERHNKWIESIINDGIDDGDIHHIISVIPDEDRSPLSAATYIFRVKPSEVQAVCIETALDGPRNTALSSFAFNTFTRGWESSSVKSEIESIELHGNDNLMSSHVKAFTMMYDKVERIFATKNIVIDALEFTDTAKREKPAYPSGSESHVLFAGGSETFCVIVKESGASSRGTSYYVLHDFEIPIDFIERYVQNRVYEFVDDGETIAQLATHEETRRGDFVSRKMSIVLDSACIDLEFETRYVSTSIKALDIS